MKKKLCSQIYSINLINMVGSKGCAKLVPVQTNSSQPTSTLNLLWQIIEFPMEHQGMPGSPYTVQVNLTIFDKTNYLNTLLSGQIIYQIHSGTLINYSNLGIPYSTYTFILESNSSDKKFKAMLSLCDTNKIIISNWI